MTVNGASVHLHTPAFLAFLRLANSQGRPVGEVLAEWLGDCARLIVEADLFDEEAPLQAPLVTSRVHRLSLNAAMLWAVSLGVNRGGLYREASNLLMGRSEQGGAPAAPTPGRPSVTRRHADGSMEVLVRLKPEPAALLRAVAELEDDTPLGVIYWALRDYAVGALVRGGRDREREVAGIFDDNAPEENEGAAQHPPSGDDTILAADTLALVKRYRRATGREPVDIVNGVLTGWLEHALEREELNGFLATFQRAA